MSPSYAWIALSFFVSFTLLSSRAFAGAPPFRCDPPSATLGTVCIGSVSGYPREVAWIVPPSYRPKDKADLVIHLHGFNPSGRTLRGMLQFYKYAEGMAASRRDAILVVPLSYGQCDDFNESLADRPEHFKAFVQGAMAAAVGAGFAKTAELASITLTAHSGGYNPVGAILDSRVESDRIREVDLFDATYGRAEEFETFAAQANHRFWSVYHNYDSNFQAVNGEVMAFLRQRGIEFDVATGPNVSAQEVLKNRVGFIISDVDHDATSTKYLPMLLVSGSPK